LCISGSWFVGILVVECLDLSADERLIGKLDELGDCDLLLTTHVVRVDKLYVDGSLLWREPGELGELALSSGPRSVASCLCHVVTPLALCRSGPVEQFSSAGKDTVKCPVEPGSRDLVVQKEAEAIILLAGLEDLAFAPDSCKCLHVKLVDTARSKLRLAELKPGVVGSIADFKALDSVGLEVVLARRWKADLYQA
jgi:hypothetical protein